MPGSAKKRFTEQMLERLRPPATGRLEIADELCPGLVLRVTDSGVRTLSTIYRVAGEGGISAGGRIVAGKQHRITLGHWPALKLTEARDRARDIVTTAKSGRDPKRVTAETIAARRENSFSAVLARHIAQDASRSISSWRNVDRVLRLHVAPKFGDLPIDEIRRADVHQLLDELVAAGKVGTAREVRKHLAGDTVLVIDNVDHPLGGQFLNGLLTSSTAQVRILGKSQMVPVPSSILMIATGNNVQLVGDLTRRTVKARLDTGMENPETRSFDFDPRDEARAQRPELVAAGLTILRAYQAAGGPVDIAALGSFERWSVVREALVWLGRPDPVETHKGLVDADPMRAELAELLTTMVDAFGKGRPLTANEMIADNSGRAIVDLLGDGPGKPLNGKALGRRLAKHVDRPVGGLVLKRNNDASHGYKYWVEEASATPSSTPEPEQSILDLG